MFLEMPEENTGQEFSRAESFIWGERRVKTLGDIQKLAAGANSSLLVAEGFDKILGTTTDKVTEEWNKQKELADNSFEKRGFWSKAGSAFRKARFERFSRKFLSGLEKQKERIHDGIERVKATKKLDVEKAERKIKAAFAKADDVEKTNYWALIRDAIKDPKQAVGIARMFDIKGNAANTDFLEALKNLGQV